MAQVLIRNIESEVLARLKQKAEQEGLSLETYLRAQLKEAARPSRAEIVAEIEAIRNQTKPWQPGDPTSVDYIREGREERDAALAPRAKTPS